MLFASELVSVLILKNISLAYSFDKTSFISIEKIRINKMSFVEKLVIWVDLN